MRAFLITLLIVTIFCGECISVFSVESYTKDSLLNVINTSNDDKAKVDAYIELSKLFFNKFSDSSIHYAMQAVVLAEKSDYKKGLMLSFNNLGTIYNMISNYAQSMEYSFKSLRLSEQEYDTTCMAQSLNNIGVSYRGLEQYDMAVEYYRKALALHEATGNKLGISSILNNLGIIYYLDKDFKNALECYTKSLLIKEKINDTSGFSRIYNIIGMIYKDLKMNTDALEYFKKAYYYATLTNNIHSQTSAKVNLGAIYFQMNELAKSEKWLLDAFETAKKINLKDQMKESGTTLSELYEKKKNFPKALYYFKLAAQIRDSLLSSENNTKIAILQIQYNLDKKQKEIDSLSTDARLQEKESEKYMLFMITFASAFVLICLLVIFLLRNMLKLKKANTLLHENEKQLSQANIELEAQTQEALYAYDRMEQLNATKDKFFSIIAHDLKNPVGSFKELTAMLSDSYHEISDEERKEMIDMMKGASAGVFQLLENLLEWSRTQSGTMKFEPRNSNLTMLIKYCTEPLKITAEKKNITIKYELADDLYAYCDENMISAVLRNLVSNAIKFTESGGEIKISGNYIDDNKFVHIAVSDNGVGMSPEQLKKLFRIDVNSSTLGTHKEKGTGLGLIICKEFIERHNGKIWVDSVRDLGSTFNINLPAAIQQKEVDGLLN